MRKDGQTERCVLLDAQMGYKKREIQIKKKRKKTNPAVYKHIR
jgi:hypothetical protein